MPEINGIEVSTECANSYRFPKIIIPLAYLEELYNYAISLAGQTKLDLATGLYSDNSSKTGYSESELAYIKEYPITLYVDPSEYTNSKQYSGSKVSIYKEQPLHLTETISLTFKLRYSTYEFVRKLLLIFRLSEILDYPITLHDYVEPYQRLSNFELGYASNPNIYKEYKGFFVTPIDTQGKIIVSQPMFYQVALGETFPSGVPQYNMIKAYYTENIELTFTEVFKTNLDLEISLNPRFSKLYGYPQLYNFINDIKTQLKVDKLTFKSKSEDYKAIRIGTGTTLVTGFKSSYTKQEMIRRGFQATLYGDYYKDYKDEDLELNYFNSVFYLIKLIGLANELRIPLTVLDMHDPNLAFMKHGFFTNTIALDKATPVKNDLVRMYKKDNKYVDLEHKNVMITDGVRVEFQELIHSYV